MVEQVKPETRSGSERKVGFVPAPSSRLALASSSERLEALEQDDEAKMVRLITHNLLSCHSRHCSPPSNFPLRFEACTKVEVRPVDLNEAFLRPFLVKLDWKALASAARQVRFSSVTDCGTRSSWTWQLGDESLPEEPPALDSLEEVDEQTLQALHHVLLEVSAALCALCIPKRTHACLMVDPCTRRQYGLPFVRSHLCDQRRDTQHGQSIALCAVTNSMLIPCGSSWRSTRSDDERGHSAAVVCHSTVL